MPPLTLRGSVAGFHRPAMVLRPASYNRPSVPECLISKEMSGPTKG